MFPKYYLWRVSMIDIIDINDHTSSGEIYQTHNPGIETYKESGG